MVKWVALHIAIFMLQFGYYFAYERNNESNGGENQSAAAITKNKYQLFARYNVSNIIAINASGVTSDLKDANLHTNISNGPSAALNKISETNSYYKNGLNDNETITNNSSPEYLKTTQRSVLMESEVFNVPYVGKMTAANTKSYDKRDTFGANRTIIELNEKYVDQFHNMHVNETENLASVRNASSMDDNILKIPESMFHLFTELYDHHLWNTTTYRHKLSYDCAVDMDIYLEQLRQQRNWALQVSDSSGRYAGLSFFGNDFWLGSKSFCEEINQVNSIDHRLENGQAVEMIFFVASIKMKIHQIATEPKILQLGQCLPKNCTKRDVYNILTQDPIAKIILNDNACKTTNSTYIQDNCNKINIFELRTVPGEYSLLNDRRFFLLSLVGIILTTTTVFASYYKYTIENHESVPVGLDSTLSSTKSKNKQKMLNHGKANELDNKTIESHIMHSNLESNKKYASVNEFWIENKHIGIVSKILLCFAVGPNSKTILSVDRANEDSITCVHGLRVYSLLWTIMVHTYLQLFAVGENRYGRKITERSFTYQVVGNATFSVDTFFFISGVLVVVLFFRTTKKINDKNDERPYIRYRKLIQTISRIFLSILYRFLRLTPAYLFVIILNELALKWTYGRSVFTPGIIDHITCHNYWWRNILYINNWYPFSEMCMIWSWYLANDMQFYIIAIIALSFAVRYFKTTAFIMLLLMACSWITSIFISIKFNYSYKVAEPFESFDILYDKPWQRITPYLMGMVTGYIYYFKKTPPKVSSIVNILLWACSLATIFGLVFGVWKGTLSVPETALYVSLGHTAWGAALVWITLSCCWGYASIVNRILSYRGLYPLSRLSYCAYLLHPVIMMVTSFQMEAPMHLQHVMVVTVFFGNAVISFILSFFVSIVFEAPVIKLLKIAFKK
ncbi:O-acyltransferase like protein isoform X2 [Wyeomyia smithii]|nr:O-acyltransferase like protein isoform X2 [Wyeomyia smithii]